jgi:hypothetical protein
MKATATEATVDHINLNTEETKRAAADRDKKERQAKLDQLSADATYICGVMREHSSLMLAADTCFAEKMEIQQFRDAVDNLMDWSSNKRNSDRLVVNGKTYKSIKEIFRHEFGVSYDTVRRHSLKMTRLGRLMDLDDKLEAATAAAKEAEAAGTPPPQKPSVTVMPKPPQAKPSTPPPTQAVEETLSINGHAPIDDLVRSTLDHIDYCRGPLTVEETSIFYGKLIDELQNDLDELDGGE